MRGEIRHDLGEPPRRQHQRIAAGQDDFPYFGMGTDIGQRVVVGALRERGRLARSDHFAAKAEPAIHRADMNQLEQHPIGIAMHDAGDRRIARDRRSDRVSRPAAPPVPRHSECIAARSDPRDRRDRSARRRPASPLPRSAPRPFPARKDPRPARGRVRPVPPARARS